MTKHQAETSDILLYQKGVLNSSFIIEQIAAQIDPNRTIFLNDIENLIR